MAFDQTTTAGGFSDLKNLNHQQKYLKGDALKVELSYVMLIMYFKLKPLDMTILIR